MIQRATYYDGLSLAQIQRTDAYSALRRAFTDEQVMAIWPTICQLSRRMGCSVFEAAEAVKCCAMAHYPEGGRW